MHKPKDKAMEHRVFTVSAFKEDGTSVAVDLTHDDLSEQGRIRLSSLPDLSPLFNTDISESGFKKMLDAAGRHMSVYDLTSGGGDLPWEGTDPKTGEYIHLDHDGKVWFGYRSDSEEEANDPEAPAEHIEGEEAEALAKRLIPDLVKRRGA